MLQSVIPGGDTASRIDSVGDGGEDFATTAHRWPHQTAIVHNGIACTYRELEERVRAAASRCRAGEFIGVLVSHHPAVAEHLLGVLQAEAWYCPIDATLPDGRIKTLTNVLGVDRLFAAGPQLHDRPNLRIEAIGASARSADAQLLQILQRGGPAYVLCTSGSTGKPKPVAVSRQALSATVHALRDLFELTTEDRVLQFASLGWDTCLEEILPALTAGAALVFDDVAHCGSFPPFVRMLAERKITVLDLPTAFWHELVLFLHEERATLPDSVRLVIIGGERVDPTRLRQWRDLDLERIRLLNTYGCTETTMITHAVQLNGPDTEPGVVAEGAEAPIGRPLPHVRDYVTDEGELLISGPGLASGYLGLPELSDAAFPVVDHGGGPARWFHTGDLVTRGDGGLLYSRGRVDEQLKIRGVRVHPAEVEAQLHTHPDVTGAVVVGEQSLVGTALVAYVVAARDITSAEIKRYLRDRLPQQFVPARVSFVKALAYTASGKVDRVATQRAFVDNSRTGTNR